MIEAPYLPTTELVAVAWLSQRVVDLDAAQVGTTLPKVGLWPEGFVTVTAITRSADVDVPQRRAGYVQLDAWAAPGEGSLKSPWARANRLAELVMRATGDGQLHGAPVALPAAYLGARVQSVYLATEPERVPGDPGGFARYRADLAVDWVLNP